jgi:hypothetical protein
MAKISLTVLPGEFHLAAVAALRKAGLHDEARELHQRELVLEQVILRTT